MNKIPVEEQLTQETMGKLWDNYHNIGILSQKYLADVQDRGSLVNVKIFRHLYALEWG